MTVPYAFGAATSAIPLSQLDSNFNTPITLGNTAIQLGNTVTTLNNMTLANVTITSGSVTITSGNVTVTNANVTSALTLSGLTASTALALDASKNVVSVTNTGTGNNVLSASPTLTGTVNAASVTLSSDFTLSAGTANGVAYLNGSKVLTTGSALTFDAARFSFIKASNGRAWSADGDDLFAIENSTSANADFRTSTTGATYLMFSDTDARARGYVAYLHGSDSMPFAVAGSEQMRLTSTGLGIGTSSPSEHLHVYGSSNQRLLLQSTAASGVAVSTQYKTASRTWEIGQAPGIGDNSFTIYDATAAAVRAVFDSSGNLGLGVTPSAWSGQTAFQLVGSAAIASSNQYLDIQTNSYYNSGSKYIGTGLAARYTQAAGVHQWFTAPSGTAGNAISFTQAMTLDASGNLAIGNTSAALRVEISGASSGETYQMRIGAGASNSAYTYDIGRSTVDGYLYFYGNQSGANGYIFSGANGERARITSAGSFVAGGSVALATTATDGFLYVPTCAGTPTGTPTAITGMAPIVVNTTNNKLYFYSGGAWRDAGP